MRDELRGTGGSLYYLNSQDIIDGSLRLHVEVREQDSDRVRQRIDLIEGQDYEFDPFQGRILLSRPLQNTVDKRLLAIIRDQPLDGDAVFLVAEYEYVSANFIGENINAGGRAKVWINDNLALGGSYINEAQNNNDFERSAVDLTLRAGRESLPERRICQQRISARHI